MEIDDKTKKPISFGHWPMKEIAIRIEASPWIQTDCMLVSNLFKQNIK